MTQTAPAVRKDVPVIVFGRDHSGKAHASWFNKEDAELAGKAAKKMGLNLVQADTGEQTALTEKLPKGRVFASGRAFVPFIKETLYTHLEGVAKASGVAVVSRTADVLATADNAMVAATSTPQGWDKIEVGSLVLATLGGKRDPWFESIVLSVNDDLFTLYWRDYPHEGQFARQRDQLALMPAGLSA
jgi:hypothetical protein